MQVVEFLIGTDSVHVRIDAVAWLYLVFGQTQPLPFGQRVNHLSLCVTQILDRERHCPLHAIQVVVDAKSLKHEQRSRHAAQSQFGGKVLLKEFLD